MLRAQTRDSVWCANDADDTINRRHVRSSEPGEKERCAKTRVTGESLSFTLRPSSGSVGKFDCMSEKTFVGLNEESYL